MSRILLSPAKYVQGKGELARLAQYVLTLGQKPFILISSSGQKRFGKVLSDGFNGAVVFEIFGGECCQQEIDRVTTQYTQSGCDVLVAVGGGKIFDTAKCVSIQTNAPIAIVPTIASTDAPCSAVAVVYTPDGVPEKSMHMAKNPDVVVVDSQVIADAPVRLFVAGMGDALATFFEARACQRGDGNNSARAKSTLASVALAQLCYETLLSDGLRAKVAVEKHLCTKAVENVIEANTLLSGIGFESGGLAAAHPVHDGLSFSPKPTPCITGKKWRSARWCSSCWKMRRQKNWKRLCIFAKASASPTTLCALGLHNPGKEQILKAAELAAKQRCMDNLPFDVTADDIADAIWAADAIGHYYGDADCCC
ncbi:MAG: glycerol dehydrogenase [Christensenellales bacterium]